MRILAVSDVEEDVLTETKTIDGIDLIISCGDLNESYLSYLSTVYGAPLFFVRGNHDLAITPDIVVGENLHNRLIHYHKLKLLGFEGSPNYTRDAVQYNDGEMYIMVAGSFFKAVFKGKPDIIVTHAPPKGLHEGDDFCHRGFKAFNWAISRFKPRFFIHGHTHLNYVRNSPRISMVGQTKVINVYGYHVFEI